jgi:hypothetical protein
MGKPSSVISQYLKRYSLRELARALSLPEHGISLSYEKLRTAGMGDSRISFEIVHDLFQFGNNVQHAFAEQYIAEQWPCVNIDEDCLEGEQ